MKNYIGISRDHSGSMYNLTRAAARDYNSLIDTVKCSATELDIDTIVSVVKCGVGRPAKVVREVVNSNVTKLVPLQENKYEATGTSTPLFDSIGELIEMFEQVPDAKDPEVGFLIMVVTDGYENDSRRWTARKLSAKIKALQATDKWTFTFRVPKGHARSLINFGIPEGNILEWELSNRGVEQSSVATKQAMTTYFTERKSGKTSSQTFYANIGEVSKEEVKANLIDISGEVSIWPVSESAQIRPFCETRLQGPMKKGAAFYQLMKTERAVQDYKVICIRDKSSGAVYSGHAARQMLGLPNYGTVRLAPGDHGDYEIFIQSTSVNRKLLPGTQLLYWNNAR